MRCAETGCCASLLSWSCLSALAAVAVCWQRGDNRLNLGCRKQQQKHPMVESSAICSLTSKVWVLFFHKVATGECFYFQESVSVTFMALCFNILLGSPS